MDTATIANVLAHAALITVVKSGWELFRMIRKKLNDNSVRNETPYLYGKLQRAHIESLVDSSEYSYWRRKLWNAEKEYDCKSRTKSPYIWLTNSSAYLAGY
jgi:ribosome assembly protein 4